MRLLPLAFLVCVAIAYVAATPLTRDDDLPRSRRATAASRRRARDDLDEPDTRRRRRVRFDDEEDLEDDDRPAPRRARDDDDAELAASRRRRRIAASPTDTDTPTYLDEGTYSVYRNPIRLTSKDELRDSSGSTLYSLAQNHVLSWGYTLKDERAKHEEWTARSGIGIWTKFTNSDTQEEIELDRKLLKLAYTFKFSFGDDDFMWQQELPTWKYRMHLFKTTGGRKVKLATLERTFFQIHKRAEITVLKTLVDYVRREPKFEGLFVGMAMRLNQEIKETQQKTAAVAAVGTGVVIGAARRRS